MTLALAAAVLSLAAAQTAPGGGTPTGGSGAAQSPTGGQGTPPSAGAPQSAGSVSDLTPPPSMSLRIPGTRKSPTETSAGIDLGLLAEVLTQSLQITGGASQVETGMQVVPTVAVGLTIPSFGFALGYSPQLYLVTFSEGPLDTLHRGWALAEWRASPVWHLYFAERLSYGNEDLTTPVTAPVQGAVGQQPQTLNPVSVASLLYLNNEVSLGIAARLSPRLRLTAAVSYLASGGLSTAGQEVMPYQYGPLVEFTLDWAVTRKSRLSTTLTGQASIFPVVYPASSTSTGPVGQPGPQIYVATLMETWRVQLSRFTSAWVIAGGSAANTSALTYLTYRAFSPVAGLGIESGTRSRQELRAFVQLLLAPYVDPYLAIEYQRLSLNASLSWHPSARWMLGLAGTAAWVPYSVQSTSTTPLTADKYGTVGPVLSFIPSKALSFTAGAYWQFQLANQAEGIQPSFNQWGAYLSGSFTDFEHF